MRAELWISLALVLATLVTFSEIRNAGFLAYDDDRYVTQNEYVARGLSLDGLVWAATTDRLSNWHPVTWLSHMLDVEIFGLRPGAHHVVSLGLHAANVVLLFLLFSRLTAAVWRSAMLAGLFALHPLHVESVAWIAERKDVLSTFFWLATLAAYARYARAGSRRAYAAALAAFALGLMTKSMLVTLPMTLLLLDVWPLRRVEPGAVRSLQTWRPLLVEKLPLFALSFVATAIAVVTQRSSGTMWTLDLLPMTARMANAAVSYARYLLKLLWPADLSIFYPHPIHWDALQVWGAVVLLVALTAACVALWRRAPYLGVGWLFFVGTLVPTIGLVQIGNQSMADRYTYVPALGVFWILAWGVPDLIARTRRARLGLGVLGVAALGMCGYTSHTYASRWTDTISIFEHALASTRDNATAHNVLGAALYRRGRHDEALPHLDAAVRIAPTYGLAHYHRGEVLLRLNRADEGVESLRRAVELRPHHAFMRFGLGLALERSGDLTRAEAEYRQGLALEPDDPGAQTRLGAVLGGQGRLDEAMAAFEKVLATRPDRVDTRVSLARALDLAGRDHEAVPQYRAALLRYPDARRALRGLAWIRAAHPDPALRNGQEAVGLARRILAIEGGSRPGDWDLLGAALAEAGRFDDAIRVAERASTLAQESDTETLRRGIAERLDLYRQRAPYRTPVANRGTR